MLTPQQLEKVADTIVPIWDELKEWITLDLIDRIISRLDSGEDISFSSSEMWRIEVFEELGGLTEDLQEQIVKTTRASENEVRRIFLEYGEQAVRADNAVFDGNNLASTEENTSYKPENSSVQAENRRDVNDVSTAAEIPSESRTGDETTAENKPLDNISDRMKDIMNDAYERTNGELRNFTRTTADSVQTEFIKELDRAYLKVVSNACSQWQAAQEAVDNIIKHQGYVTYPSGHVDTIEVAVIRAIRTGVARMSAALVVEGAKKHGMNHVLVSSHLGARVGDGTESPCNHAWWQGKVYSIEGGDEKYPNLEKVTGYPSDPRGLCGYNCRHNLTAFDSETMKNHFEKFDDEENKKAYEFSQKLRYYERNIRKAKTEITAFSKAVENCKDENLAEHFQTELDKAKARLDRLNEEYKKLCEDNDLRVAYERLYVARTPRNIEDLRNKGVANSENRIDYMSNSFRPAFADSKPISFQRGNETDSIEVKKVSNSNFNMVTDVENTRRNKAVRFTERNLTAIRGDLPKGFELPQIAVVDFNKHNINSNAIGGYDWHTGILYVNSRYDTTEKILGFVNQTQGMFANNTQYAPVLHELGHKYYYDSINRLAISKGIEYNNAKDIVDSKLSEFIRKSNVESSPFFLMKNLSGYAYKGYSDNLITEVIAESFSVMHKNGFAKGLIDTLNEVIL